MVEQQVSGNIVDGVVVGDTGACVEWYEQV